MPNNCETIADSMFYDEDGCVVDVYSEVCDDLIYHNYIRICTDEDGVDTVYAVQTLVWVHD